MTVRDLITETFQDLTVLAAGDSLDATMAADGLRKLSRLLDDFNAERAAVYATRFETFTMVPALQPHTIGPAASSPTFTVTQRPVAIEQANLVLTSVSPAVHQPMNLRDAQWWSYQAVPALTTSIPTDLYYEPEWPLGKLYLWPIPNAAYGIELFTRIVLSDLGLDDDVSYPPGYYSAILLTLGEMLSGVYPTAIPKPDAAAKARARIMANNDVLPPLATVDSGMPGRGQTGQFFSWRRGMNI